MAAPAEAPSPDVVLAQDASPLPGVHRGGFTRLPTAPVGVTGTTAPAEPGTEAVQWVFPEPPARAALAGWALTLSILALAASLFVAWGLPLGLAAVITAVVSLRRPRESRAVAIWALTLGAVSMLYSAGWLLWAATRGGIVVG